MSKVQQIAQQVAQEKQTIDVRVQDSRHQSTWRNSSRAWAEAEETTETAQGKRDETYRAFAELG